MNHKLIHIFDNSACLTRKQLRDYISCKMIDEEAHATEVHLISCKLCSEAVEGYTKNNSVLEAMMELDSDFLEPHFPLHDPQVHLNSIAPVEPVAIAYPYKRRKLPVWKRPTEFRDNG